MEIAPERIFVLLGNPVGHSMSPLMHNAAYREMGLKALYLPFAVTDLPGALSGLRALGIEGASVTIPFKVEAMRHLDEVSHEAAKIGAVNTIVNRGGRLAGENTDWRGIVMTLREQMTMGGATFAVLGAGGTARAALFGVLAEGGLPVVVNRSRAKGKALAEEWGCAFHPLDEIERLRADCLINTTPVGMHPHVDASPVTAAALRNFPLIMDVIYNPLETRLLREASGAGCRVLPGLEMFIRQGAEQIRLWTGLEPPLEIMRATVSSRLAEGLPEKET